MDDTDGAATTAMLTARAVLDLADALDDAVDEHGGTRAARRGRAAADRHPGPAWSRPASRSTPTTSRASSRSSATRCALRPTDAYDVIGKEINLGSPKQLQVVLFDELDMPKTKRTKTGYTTDADALQQLFEKTEHPFLQHLLRHRDVIRLRQTVEGLLKTVAVRRPDPHDLQPDHRGDRAGSRAPTPTCRTSRSAPRRVAASARASSSARATSR